MECVPTIFIVRISTDPRGSSWSVGFTTTCAISAYHHLSCEFELRSWQHILHTTLCDKVCQWLAVGRWLSPGTPVSSTNKTDHPDITKILLKVALNTITIPIVQHISVVGRPIPCKNIHFIPFENYPLITLNVVLFVELHVSVDYRSFGCRVRVHVISYTGTWEPEYACKTISLAKYVRKTCIFNME